MSGRSQGCGLPLSRYAQKLHRQGDAMMLTAAFALEEKLMVRLVIHLTG